MALVLIGINHNTANVDLREKVAFPPELVDEALTQLMAGESVDGAVIVSTCNRTEIYVAYESSSDARQLDVTASNSSLFAERKQSLLIWLAAYHSVSVDDLQDCNYSFAEQEVVKHLMRVSCGLDSMVLGEPQILGQIKSAYAVSKDKEALGPTLGLAFQEAFSIAKEVRTDTAIGENPVSVAYAAVTLAERIFSNLSSLNVLLIGAGRTIELVVKHLAEKGVTEIVVANRTLGNAMKIADQFDAHGALLSEIPELLVAADIVVSSTNSQLPLLGKGAVERALKQRKHKPMLLVDLAVPRDIEAEVAEVADAYLYSVDDISEVIEDSVKSRAEAAAQAESIIARGVQEFLKHLRSLNAISTLRAFREKADSIREQELQKALQALEKGGTAEDVLNTLARGLTNKLIHSPSVQMKKASSEGRDEVLSLTKELYELDLWIDTDEDSDEDVV